MRESDIKEKVKVFISSNIDEKFKLIRESLKLLLLQTGMCIVYCFEEEPASSTDVYSSYLYKIDRTDLVVFLINNADGINSGTLKEVKRSRELKKKCIFLFCNEKEKKITELQEEIMSSSTGEKYKEVSTLSHLAEEAYQSILNDIIDIYLRYCGNLYNLIDGDQNIDNEIQEKEVVITSTILKKDTYYRGNEYLISILTNYVLYDHSCSENCSEFELRFGQLLYFLLGKTTFNNLDFDLLKKAILELHSPGNLKKIVEKRLDALECYFRGSLDECILHLTTALEKAQKAKNIPKWVENDIAIDFRNIVREIDRISNTIQISNTGQKILDNSEEPVYFPVVDRASSSFYENVFINSVQDSIESPFTVKIEGSDRSLSAIVGLYIGALAYGSITHITLIREKLCYYLQYLSFKNRNHRFFVAAIEMLLLCGNGKKLENFIDAYGESTDSIGETDVLRWKKAVDSIGIKYKRLISELLLFSTFGYYFSDAQFSDFYEDIKAKIRIWVEERFADDLIARAYLKALVKNNKRISPKELMNTAYLFRKKGLRRWYNDVFKMLINLSIKGVDSWVLEQYKAWLIECCGDPSVREKSNYLPLAIQSFRIQLEESEKLDEAVKEAFPAFYESTYSLNVFKHDQREWSSFLNNQMETIQTINDEQGKNGCYTSYAVNPYTTVGNIIRNNQGFISETDIEKLCSVILATFKSEKQTHEAKISAASLLCEVFLYNNGSNRFIKKTLLEIRENKELFQRGPNTFITKGYSERLCRCMLDLLDIITQGVSEIELIQYIATASELEEAEEIIYLQNLRNVTYDLGVSKYNFKGLGSFLQYFLRATKSLNKTIRCLAYVCMLNIIRLEPLFMDIVMNTVSKAMDTETFETKAAIISRVVKLDYENSKVKYVLTKGKADNHYYVRKIADNSNIIIN